VIPRQSAHTSAHKARDAAPRGLGDLLWVYIWDQKNLPAPPSEVRLFARLQISSCKQHLFSRSAASHLQARLITYNLLGQESSGAFFGLAAQSFFLPRMPTGNANPTRWRDISPEGVRLASISAAASAYETIISGTR
jgi:hypothetical protein